MLRCDAILIYVGQWGKFMAVYSVRLGTSVEFNLGSLSRGQMHASSDDVCRTFKLLEFSVWSNNTTSCHKEL